MGVQKLIDRCKFLAVLGSISARSPRLESVGRAAMYFVLNGFLLGLLLATTNYLLQPHLDVQILALVVVTLWIASTGARHLQGLKVSFSALGSCGERANETSGFVAVAMIILFKCAAAESMDEIATLSLFLTPVLARWALLVFLYGYGSRFDETTRPLAEQVHFLHVLIGTAAVLGLAMYFLSRTGLWLALAVSVCALLLRGILFRLRGSISQAHLGATVEMSEALCLVLLASF